MPELFDAFVAGFEASGEGYNGEYVGQRLRDRESFLAEMGRIFEEWCASEDDNG